MPSALRPLQLRSNSGHCVRKLAKSLAKSWQGGSGHEVVEENEEEEKKEEEEKNNSDKI